MRILCKSSLLAVLILAGACATPGRDPSQSIEVVALNNGYQLSVPVSRLTMTLPQGNWSRKQKSSGGGTSNPRYFYFEDGKEAGLILSGWFEPDRFFEGIDTQWKKDAKAWQERGLPEPMNVSFEKVGGWDVVMYDHNFGKVVNSHLRAHWVQSGTWIDLHLSTTTSGTSADNRKKLKSVLRGISISEKGRA